MRSRLKLAAFALLACLAGQGQRAEGVAPQIRIGLLQHAEAVRFAGPSGMSVRPLRGAGDIGSGEPGEIWEARAAGGQVRVTSPAGEARLVRHGVRVVGADGGTVTVCGVAGHWDDLVGRQYRGSVEIRPGPGGGLSVINVVDIEEYLRGVVPSEMPPEYPEEALKAQAVAARGQAIMKARRHWREGFDLCAAQHCQVYGGASAEDPRTDRAVAETRGQVLMYGRHIADTLYSSNCGGHTANNEDYWPGQRPVPYLRGVPDFHPGEGDTYHFPLAEEQLRRFLKYAPRVNCNQPQYAAAEKIRWWSVVPVSDLQETLRQSIGDFGDLLGLRIVDRADCGMVVALEVIGSRRHVRLTGGAAVRSALGGLNSATFALEPVLAGDGLPVAYIIWGAGWGHQVGMCQVGAAGLADQGWSYVRILTKYYPGCRVVKRY